MQCDRRTAHRVCVRAGHVPFLRREFKVRPETAYVVAAPYQDEKIALFSIPSKATSSTLCMMT